MRKRFEQQLGLGQLPIEATYINPKSKNALDELLAALKAIYCNKEYNQEIFGILENHINSGKKNTGRTGMDLWSIFVLAQIRLCLNLSYDVLHDQANNHHNMRCLMGVEKGFGSERIEFEYQNIYDNVTLLSDEVVAEVNQVILNFGHGEVFKKKENTALRLKSDSFVVESNVHFPTDYNLLWDCARKCIGIVSRLMNKHKDIEGWRKIGNWHTEMKKLMRNLGHAHRSGGKNKKEKVIACAERYLNKAGLLLNKLNGEKPNFPITDMGDLALIITLEHFMKLLEKHIDLVDRRILKGEIIPHQEKMFSVFETYTEWITKGKMNPSVELGKKLNITTDQWGLIVDYQIMDDQQDRDIVIELADRILPEYKVASWSFDKGFWLKENKEILQLEVAQVIIPKLGKRNKQEEEQEHSRSFKKLKNKHSAIESNINELEHRGLDRCPDRGYPHFKKYIGLGVCAYNLKKIGKQILRLEREALEAATKRVRIAA
ncbi:MAG: ISNCY family transposase [Bacteroidota bacterium]|nr:ISNCY family transposase [Bacteroidota bacterium]